MALGTASIVGSSSFLILTEILILCGNILVIVAVAKNKSMQTVTNFLIVNLSITDLLVAVFNCPLMFLAILAEGWIVGAVMCKVSGFLNVVFCCASIFTLTAISVDRYYCITRPSKTIITKRKAVYMIVVIWLIVMSFAMLPILGWNKYVYIDARKHCMILWQMGGTDSAYAIFLSVSSFVVPTWIMIFCYYKIFSTARKQAKKFQKLIIAGSPQASRHAHSTCKVSPCVARTTRFVPQVNDGLILESVNTVSGMGRLSNRSSIAGEENISKKLLTVDITRDKAERRTARFILIVIGVFQICWLPYAALNQWSAITGQSPPGPADLGASLLAYFNSGCNAIIYTIFNAKFRNAFRKVQ
ncbi:hypothetical protein QZH41_015582 [Actinostola sp. cb2023]|nr:hypothetical protein QZH41_015582 [Actinostola sp. cb2023]